MVKHEVIRALPIHAQSSICKVSSVSSVLLKYLWIRSQIDKIFDGEF